MLWGMGRGVVVTIESEGLRNLRPCLIIVLEPLTLRDGARGVRAWAGGQVGHDWEILRALPGWWGWWGGCRFDHDLWVYGARRFVNYFVIVLALPFLAVFCFGINDLWVYAERVVIHFLLFGRFWCNASLVRNLVGSVGGGFGLHFCFAFAF